MRSELFGVLLLGLASTAQAEPWPSCSSGDSGFCPPTFLQVVTRVGDATLSVEAECRGDWVHLWRVDDAHAEIRQWLDGAWSRGEGVLCLPIAEEVDEIRVVPLDSHCSFAGIDVGAPPAGGVLLRASVRVLAVRGCHARLESMRFGGIALLFADGYGFGDAYAADFFYGVYDGFGSRAVGATESALFQIAEFNTHRYRVEILSRGSSAWSLRLRGDER